jgi:Carboxypeptidase regulatory-like domain/Intracellular proteinase inhibitor
MKIAPTVFACVVITFIIIMNTDANAQIAIAYPQPVLSPAAPTQNDSVALWLILGQSSNSCVPTYTSSFKITQTSKFLCVRAPCPQNYVIAITYSQNPSLLLGRPCLLVTTNYGPLFSFGKLGVGNYTVIDSTSGGTAVAAFTVTENTRSYTVNGTVLKDPGILTVITPITGAKVYLKTSGLSPIMAAQGIILPLYTIIDSAATDASGNFSFANVVQGSYDLGISAAGYQARDIAITVPPDTLVSVMLLAANAVCTVTGTVKESQCPVSGLGLPCTLVPVQGCSVSVSLPIFMMPLAKQSALIAGNMYIAVTNATGSYAIDSIPVTYTDRTVTVVASKTGYAQETSQAMLYANSSITVNFVLQGAYSNPETTTVSDVQFIVATDKPQYNRGESIKVRYTVKNNSMGTVLYDFSSGCQFDMIAMAPPKDTVYWYGRLLACTMMATQISLSPGQSQTMDYTAFVDDDTAGTLAITAKMIGYDKSASTVIVPVGKALAIQPYSQKSSDAKKPLISYSASTKTLSLNIARSQYVSVSAYVVSGKKISQLSTRKYLTAGSHAIHLTSDALSNGIIIFRVDGEGFSAVKRVNLIEGR